MQQEISRYNDIIKDANVVDYLLIDSNPKISREIYINTLTKLGDIYKKNMNKQTENINKFIECHSKILSIDFDNKNSKSELVNVFCSLCQHSTQNNDYVGSLKYLDNALQVDPVSYIVHNNLGFIYKNANQFNKSVIHYHLAIALNNNDTKVKVIAYSGLSCNFRSIQNWQQALFYLLKARALDDNDSEIYNSLGVVYTEMRRTDLAEENYLKGIQIAKNESDNEMLYNLYLNYGHMTFSNGDNLKSIEIYNIVLRLNPKNRFAFQNKIMNLVYLQDEFEDKTYLYKQHKLVNKIFKKNDSVKIYPKVNTIVRIGIISGDFTGHPVSYFISTFLQKYNPQKFSIFCYSECLIDTKVFNKDINFTLIRGMDTDSVCDIIIKNKINVLFDLSGHTGYNRMDVFAKKPVKVQISYIGYPYTTGLVEMDYRITDLICDNPGISQTQYTEKLLFMKDCFLCYNPLLRDPVIITKKPKKFTIGCFNRLNKISNGMITLINEILDKYNNIQFIFKTKALLNKNVKDDFLRKIKNINQVQIIDCAILHEQHLAQYNLIDISLDTFPYSGTTTSCESLLMGVPVLSLYDTLDYFHPQNVTVSILKNSNLENYVCNSNKDILNKIGEIQEKGFDKEYIRNCFLNGKVCDTTLYMKNFEKLINKVVK
jgi:protein O-GlcNAc transferase